VFDELRAIRLRRILPTDQLHQLSRKLKNTVSSNPRSRQFLPRTSTSSPPKADVRVWRRHVMPFAGVPRQVRSLSTRLSHRPRVRTRSRFAMCLVLDAATRLQPCLDQRSYLIREQPSSNT